MRMELNAHRSRGPALPVMYLSRVILAKTTPGVRDDTSTGQAGALPRCTAAVGLAGRRGRGLVPDPGPPAPVADRRRPLCGDRPGDGRERRLADHPLQRRQVLREAAAADVGDGHRLRALRHRRMAGSVVDGTERRGRRRGRRLRRAPLVRRPGGAVQRLRPAGSAGLERGGTRGLARHGRLLRDGLHAVQPPRGAASRRLAGENAVAGWSSPGRRWARR